LYEGFHRKVFGMAVRLVGLQEAADVTQQVFLQVFRGLATFGNRADFSTWLYRIAVNECLQHRRRDRHPRHDLPENLADRTPPIERRVEQAELLQLALARLDDNLRAVFVLREVEELSYDQIAKVLDIPAGTVASQLNRARAELRGLLRQLSSE
jgi:RNA polymerase sigma-70 factor (ECF subfamily)